MRVLCAFAQYQNGQRQPGFEEPHLVAFLPALRRLGYEVQHFDTQNPTLHATYADLNYALLAEVKRYDPDIIMTVQKDYEVWTDTLLAIRRMGKAALVTWTTDDSFKFHTVSKFIAPFYDAISTLFKYRVEDYIRAGVEGVYYTQCAANSHWLNPPKRAEDCQFSVSFVGKPYRPRVELVRALERAGIHVDCFGFGWPNGPIPTDQMPVVMRDSVISLNFSAAAESDAVQNTQIKARTFEVPGAGGFLLTDTSPGMAEVYEFGREIEVYDDFDDLQKKIRYYLQHPDERDRIAHAGYLRTVACHTWEQRLKGLLELGLERRSRRTQSRAHAASAAEEERVVEALPIPRLGVALRGLRWILLRACSLVWGPQRGPRAARRLVFGASRAVLGARTFSSESVPGRMFPYV
jgi:spore maturation protein CgeB